MLVNQINNQFEVLVEKKEVKSNLPNNGMLSVIFITSFSRMGEVDVSMSHYVWNKIQDKFCNEVNYPTFDPPMIFTIQKDDVLNPTIFTN
jgi:hypothetical protein